MRRLKFEGCHILMPFEFGRTQAKDASKQLQSDGESHLGKIELIRERRDDEGGVAHDDVTSRTATGLGLRLGLGLHMTMLRAALRAGQW